MDEYQTEEKEEDESSKLQVGTSGWSYKEWEGIFYPDAKTPKLKYYSKIFRTAEIDSTFYANPARGLVHGWAKNTPRNFEFSVKLPKVITHEKMLDLEKGAEIELLNFLELLDPIKESGKLGPLLIQLPPGFDRGKRKKLEEFLAALPKGYSFAVEFRNKSWLRDAELLSLLSKHNVANAIVDEPLMPVDLSTSTKDFAFVRWHGHGKAPWYNYLYQEGELEPWVDRIKLVSSNVKKVYGYFNNHFRGNAVENGLEFLSKMGEASALQQQALREIKEKREKHSSLESAAQSTLPVS